MTDYSKPSGLLQGQALPLLTGFVGVSSGDTAESCRGLAGDRHRCVTPVSFLPL